MIDPLFVLTARLALALLLLVAGTHKVVHFQHFKTRVAAYRLLPANVLVPVVIFLMISELFTGLSLLFFHHSRLPALAAIALLTLYFLVMAFHIWRGETRIDCGCSFAAAVAPLSVWHLLRNAALIGMAGLLWLPQTERVVHWLDLTQVVLSVICLSLLYLSIDMLLFNRTYLLHEENPMEGA